MEFREKRGSVASEYFVFFYVFGKREVRFYRCRFRGRACIEVYVEITLASLNETCFGFLFRRIFVLMF